jgi:hypothetical protein
MRKIVLIVLLAVVAFVLGLLFREVSPFFTGSVIANADLEINEKKVETFTTAVCSNDQECVDVLVTCLNGSVSKMELVSNLTKFSDLWEDKRELEGSLCY